MNDYDSGIPPADAPETDDEQSVKPTRVYAFSPETLDFRIRVVQRINYHE